ncbi:MAG TPA: cytochrome c5 family protein, partial [Gammaproteobacteria bacterium]|nr:cytochrome c5 family protein [Gammaproteobacteria bacterium]
MESQDKSVMVKLLIVVGSLVLLTVIIVMLARLLGALHTESSSASAEEMQKERLALVRERVKKIGSLDAADASATPVARSGKEIVDGVCGACHGSGVLGAPKIGDSAAWGSRMSAGFDGLVANATNGKGAMPAKGGDPTLSEMDMKKAIAQMLKDSGQEAPDFAATSTADASATTGTPAAQASASQATTDHQAIAPIEPLPEIPPISSTTAEASAPTATTSAETPANIASEAHADIPVAHEEIAPIEPLPEIPPMPDFSAQIPAPPVPVVPPVPAAPAIP